MKPEKCVILSTERERERGEKSVLLLAGTGPGQTGLIICAGGGWGGERESSCDSHS